VFQRIAKMDDGNRAKQGIGVHLCQDSFAAAPWQQGIQQQDVGSKTLKKFQAFQPVKCDSGLVTVVVEMCLQHFDEGLFHVRDKNSHVTQSPERCCV